MAIPVNISKIKVRRGLDSERLQIVLDNGELGFTTDTQRLFIGDGITTGGLPVSTRYIGKYASVNDIDIIGLGDSVVINNVAYIYTGGNINNIGSYFASVSANVDDVTISVSQLHSMAIYKVVRYIVLQPNYQQGLCLQLIRVNLTTALIGHYHH